MPNRTPPDLHRPSKGSPPGKFQPEDLALDEASDGQDAGDAPTDGTRDVQMGGDTGFDRVVGPEEAGLGGGLDQAEEAILGVTDEELAAAAERERNPKPKK